jgi:NADH dehydrogenase
MKNNRVCILGGTGFVGRHLTATLTSMGFECKIPTRHIEPNKAMLLYGPVELVKANIFDLKQLSSLFSNCDTVINLVGILNENSKGGFQRAHLDLTRLVIDGCKQAKVTRLLHMSALNANASGKLSTYLRTKGEAQNLVMSDSVRQDGINATSFGPSVIFGPDDSFFNRFAGLLKLLPGPFPLACASSRFAPVYIGDVAGAFAQALNNKNSWGKHFDLCGPRIFTLRQLVKYTAEQLELNRPIIELPDMLARMQGHILGHFPGKPFSYDNYLSLQIDSVCNGDSGLDKLGIEATDIDAVVPYYLGQSSERSRYLQLRRLS